MSIKISIIVPVYKVEKYLRDALDSILFQTYTNWEAICIDDGSPDDCGAILDEYANKDSRFKVIHQNNGGVSSARNNGLRNLSSDSDYVTFLDSDDVLDIGMLEKCVGFIYEYRPDVISFGCKYVSENFKNNRSDDDKNISLNIVNGEKECFYYCWSHSKLIQTGVWSKIWDVKKIKDIYFFEGIKTGEDAMFNWCCSYNYSKMLITDYQGYYYRSNPTSILHSKHVLAALVGWYMRTKVIFQFIKSGKSRFYKFLPLIGFIKHISFVVLHKLKLRDSASFSSLSFPINDKKWNSIILFIYWVLLHGLRVSLSGLIFCGNFIIRK